MRTPDFNNILAVLDRKVPSRPTLFEFFMNEPLYAKLAGIPKFPPYDNSPNPARVLAKAWHKAGYDYATITGSAFGFQAGKFEIKASRSANEGAVIFDRESFNRYPWPDPDSFDYSVLEKMPAMLPSEMKLIACGPDGILESVTNLVGYEAMCMMTLENPRLLADVFDAVGSRTVRCYEIMGSYPAVGAMISSDDWGFKTQTILSPADLRKYVFPWHRKITKVTHEAGCPAILHSCGRLTDVMDDIIDDMKFDGKHSYEDAIEPVEEAYEKYSHRIAILGGIDLDFVCRSTPEKIRQRSRAMLERTKTRGAYALGTGNSVPEYVPDENYFAMTSAVME